MKIDGYYGEAYYNRARSKCRLDKINECLDDLKIAIELDERYIDLAKKDEDFNSIKDNEEFRLLLSRQTTHNQESKENGDNPSLIENWPGWKISS